MNYLIYGHGGSYNHGAEALAKCTIKLLREISPNCSILLSTHFAEQDKEFKLSPDEYIERNPNGKTNEELYTPTMERITEKTVCIHIGGDNYCYSNWQRWAMIHYKALEHGAKSILWGCSIDPQAINDEMLDALRTHNLIMARERITYETLVKCGLTNVVKVSDIAFLLQSESALFELNNFVAINMSPLVLRLNPKVLDAYRELVRYILGNTKMNIALVPHVLQPSDNDLDALRLLGSDNEFRIKNVDGRLSVANYKYIISNAQFCIAARTHAAIAAYSTYVPTLAVGYSTKAIGIATDLGMADYVCDIETANNLTDKFRLLIRDAENIRKQLAEIMPNYKQSAVPENVINILKSEAVL